MNKQENKAGSIKKGIGFVVLGHIIYIICFCGLPYLAAKIRLWDPGYLGLLYPLIFLSFIWFIQFIYVVPIIIYALYKQEKQTLKGILITSGITFLLGCGICGSTLFPSYIKERTYPPEYYCKSNKLYSEYVLKPFFRKKFFQQFTEKTELYDFSKSTAIIGLDCCNSFVHSGLTGIEDVIPTIGKNFNGIYLIKFHDTFGMEIGSVKKEFLKPLCQIDVKADPVIELAKIKLNMKEYRDYVITTTKPDGSQELKIEVLNIDKLKKEKVIYYKCSSTQPLQKDKCN